MPGSQEDRRAWASYTRPDAEISSPNTSLPPIRSWFPSLDHARLDAELKFSASPQHANQPQSGKLADQNVPIFCPSSPSSAYTTSEPDWWQCDTPRFVRSPHNETEGEMQYPNSFNTTRRPLLDDELRPVTFEQPHIFNSHQIDDRPESTSSQALPHQSFANMSLSAKRNPPTTSVARIPAVDNLESARSRLPTLTTQFHTSRPLPEQQLIYELVIREQPVHARVIGYSEKELRTIDPHPILELRISDVHGRSMVDNLFNPATHFVTVALYDVHGKENLMAADGEPEYVKNLQGCLAATGFMDRDEYDQRGCFFRFDDLRCRVRGRFRLLFTFVILDVARMHIGVPIRLPSVSVFSDPFDAVRQKEFGGKVARSLLAASLRVGRSRHRVVKDRRRLLEPPTSRPA